DFLWILGVQVDYLGTDALERRQVTDDAGLQIDGREVVIFVAVAVLQVDELLAVKGPDVGADAAFLVVGQGAIVVLADGSHPDLLHVLGIRSDVGQVFAVRRNVRAGLFRIAEEDRSGNERRQLGGRRVDPSQNHNHDGQITKAEFHAVLLWS